MIQELRLIVASAISKEGADALTKHISSLSESAGISTGTDDQNKIIGVLLSERNARSTRPS